MLESALAVARDVVTANRKLHDNLSAALTADERVEGAALQVRWAVWGMLFGCKLGGRGEGRLGGLPHRRRTSAP